VAQQRDSAQPKDVEDAVQPCDRAITVAMPPEVDRVAQPHSWPIQRQRADPLQFI